MRHSKVSIETPDGAMSTHRVGDPGDPAVIVLMAALGVDENMLDIAGRLADNGYFALIPDLYYRWGKGLTFDPATDRGRAVKMLTRITDRMVISDVGALLATLDDRPVGAMGFCMGGRFVVRTMAAYPERIVACSALHPSYLFLEGNADSPHLDIARISGELYVGFGEIDPVAPPRTWEVVRGEVRRHGIRAHIDIHPDAAHGFMLPNAGYQEAAAEASWTATLKLLCGLRSP